MIRLTLTADNSGYGQANKMLASLFLNAGFDISTNLITTPMSRHDVAQDSVLTEIIKRTSNKKADINIVQLVPNLWHYGFQKGARNIGFLFWETDRIGLSWLDIINNGLCDEVWVPCPSNRDALLNSGVKKPIYVIPQYTKIETIERAKAKEILPIPNDDLYTFYSIFQWTERKNPEALISAYCEEFCENDKTLLVIKTYGPSPFADRRWIKERIQDIKAKVHSNAPIYLLDRLLSPDKVNAIAPQGNCYITTTRGEGWNLPLVEALAYKQQVITPKTGGIVDWADENSVYIIPHKLIDIDTSKQAWSDFYKSDPPQKWGDVETINVRKAMRQAYNQRNDCSKYTDRYSDILKFCSQENIIRLIKERMHGGQ